MEQNAVFEFLKAAFPWIAIGIVLAVIFARSAIRKKDAEKREDYGSEGMALGMCFGVAMGTALHINMSFGMILGMLVGLVIGSQMEKK